MKLFSFVYLFTEQNTDFNSPVRNEYFDASAPRNDYHSSVASSTPLVATPSGRGRPKGSSSLKSSKKSSKASTSFSIAASTNDSDKKSQSFADNQSANIDSQMNLLNTVDEQVSIQKENSLQNNNNNNGLTVKTKLVFLTQYESALSIYRSLYLFCI